MDSRGRRLGPSRSRSSAESSSASDGASVTFGDVVHQSSARAGQSISSSPSVIKPAESFGSQQARTAAMTPTELMEQHRLAQNRLAQRLHQQRIKNRIAGLEAKVNELQALKRQRIETAGHVDIGAPSYGGRSSAKIPALSATNAEIRPQTKGETSAGRAVPPHGNLKQLPFTNPSALKSIPVEERRVIQNRLSQRASRKRKKDRIKELEALVADLEHELQISSAAEKVNGYHTQQEQDQNATPFQERLEQQPILYSSNPLLEIDSVDAHVIQRHPNRHFFPQDNLICIPQTTGAVRRAHWASAAPINSSEVATEQYLNHRRHTQSEISFESIYPPQMPNASQFHATTAFANFSERAFPSEFPSDGFGRPYFAEERILPQQNWQNTSFLRPFDQDFELHSRQYDTEFTALNRSSNLRNSLPISPAPQLPLQLPPLQVVQQVRFSLETVGKEDGLAPVLPPLQKISRGEEDQNVK